MPTLEFYFDFTSPFTYLAFGRIREVAMRTVSKIVWKPMLLDFVFEKVNPAFYEQLSGMNRRKAEYYNKDIGDWAGFCGITIRTPVVYPLRATEAMCGAIVALEAGLVETYASAVFKAYWRDMKDISRLEVLRAICVETGLEPSDFEQRIRDPMIEAQLRENSDTLIERGGFGSPTMFVGDSMFFGNDRIPLVEAALAQASMRRFVMPGQHG
jgi:2-hydroxychromene-2-carboxylate isomerase